MKVILTSVLAVCLSLAVVESADKPGCRYVNHLSQTSKKGEDQIAVLSGDRYTVTDASGEFTYFIAICTEAMDPYPEGSELQLAGSGVVQLSKESGNLTIVGKYNNADIMAGPEWVMLEYNGGDKYRHHCSIANNDHEARRARILFLCDPNAVEPVVTIIEEQNNKSGGCYYLFEISSTTICPKQPLITIGLSVGSVLLIVFFCVVAVYLIGGCMYNRFVLGNKGLDQIPNRAFWQDFGNLQADGCDLICRTGKNKQSRTYKGIGDDQLQDTDDQAITDENLLPM